jgi:hypothetical protein
MLRSVFRAGWNVVFTGIVVAVLLYFFTGLFPFPPSAY